MTLRRDPAKARAWQQRSAKRAAEKQWENRSARPKSKPGTRLPPRNEERADALRLAQFGTLEQTRLINSMPCCCSRAPRRHPACSRGWSDPSHIVSRAAGGDIDDQVAMSRGCHDAWHQHGRDAWLEATGWTEADLRAEADRTYTIISGMPGGPGWYAPA